jgi:hypothetical protein
MTKLKSKPKAATRSTARRTHKSKSRARPPPQRGFFRLGFSWRNFCFANKKERGDAARPFDFDRHISFVGADRLGVLG